MESDKDQKEQKEVLGVLLQQGAEARVFESCFVGRRSIVKERFWKKYRHPTLDSSHTSPPSVGKKKMRRRAWRDEPDLLKELADSIRKVAEAIKSTHPNWLAILSQHVYALTEYPADVLDELYMKLSENEKDWGRFAMMPEAAWKRFVAKKVAAMERSRADAGKGDGDAQAWKM